MRAPQATRTKLRNNADAFGLSENPSPLAASAL